jgi:serine/threonine-protein kinase
MANLPNLSDQTYRIESELGSGGGGVIYKAWHNRLQKYVVLKRIKDDSTLNNEKYQRGEADILKNLKHANLPQIYDFLTEESGVYTVMELIPGTSFAELLKSGQHFEQRDVVRWAEQLSSALAYLHTQTPPVLHSDIKPANIMLTPDGNVCLIDFNISLVLDGDSASALGVSHGYASPEQYGPQALPRDSYAEATFIDNATVNDTAITQLNMQTQIGSNLNSSQVRRAIIKLDTRSDIYSFGATLYHLITGEKPAVSTGNITPLNSFKLPISEGIIYIIERCMQPDPAQRFQSAEQLHAAIRDIHKLDSRWKNNRRSRIFAAVVLTTLLAASIASTAFGYRRLGEEKVAQYNELVYAIEQSADDSEYEKAIALFPEKIDAYHEKALKLCVPDSYQECIDYVKQIMATLSAYSWNPDDLKKLGNIYYVQGNSYFELEDYPNSLACYEAAIANNRDNPEIFRDCAIALARCEYVERAEEMLEEIRGMELGNDSIFLLRGEIAFAKREYSDAVEQFLDVIAVTDSSYIKQRAYIICDKAYQQLPGELANEIALLRVAIDDVQPNYQRVLTERLADTLVRNGDYSEAVTLFEELVKSGVPSYITQQNIGVLYQKTGDFANAEVAYRELQSTFPERYEPLMRLAYLELETQATIENEQRDYSAAAGYYEQAAALYSKRPASAGDDMEMLQLDSIIADLRANGWIE